SALGGGTLARTVQADDDLGMFENELTLPPIAGSYSDVSVQLQSSDSGKAKLPRIEVIPGEPTQLSWTSSGKVSVDGIGHATLTFTIKDKHGTLAAKGTDVGFYVSERLHIVDQDLAVSGNDGKVSIVVKGGAHAGPSSVRIRVGKVEQLVDLTVNPLKLEFIGFQNTIFANDSKTVVVRVTDV